MNVFTFLLDESLQNASEIFNEVRASNARVDLRQFKRRTSQALVTPILEDTERGESNLSQLKVVRVWKKLMLTLKNDTYFYNLKASGRVCCEKYLAKAGRSGNRYTRAKYVSMPSM